MELRRIELLTSCLQSRRSPKLSYSPQYYWWARVGSNH